MPVIHLTRQHALDETKVRQHIEELAETLSTRLGADYQWQDDKRLEFNRSGAHGYVLQEPGQVEIYIKLGMMLSPLKGTIEDGIGRYMDRQFAGKD